LLRIILLRLAGFRFRRLEDGDGASFEGDKKD
jgi:hypothetical protein